MSKHRMKKNIKKQKYRKDIIYRKIKHRKITSKKLRNNIEKVQKRRKFISINFFTNNTFLDI